MEFGEKIKKARKAKGLTQKQLAETLGVAEITVRKYENNEREPRLDMLDKIAKALDVSTAELLKGTGEFALDFSNVEKNNRFSTLINRMRDNSITSKEQEELYVLIKDLGIPMSGDDIYSSITTVQKAFVIMSEDFFPNIVQLSPENLKVVGAMIEALIEQQKHNTTPDGDGTNHTHTDDE